jgi:DNA-binding response OmpR family regulator
MFGPRRILIVDDDVAFRSTLAEQLSRERSLEVAEAGTVGEALRLLTGAGERIDLLLLDIGLPDGDGRDLCATLRRTGVTVPVIMLTAAAEEQDVVRGLDSGANDFIVKPFRLSELLARVRAQLRAFEFSEHAEIGIGPFVFRPGARLLQQPGRSRPIRLTEKEAALLKYLYRAAGRGVSRHTLLREVWGYSPDVSSHTVETHIYRLRRKIEAGGDTPQIVLNDGNGYRLATLEPLEQPAPAAATLAKWHSAPATPPVQPPPRVLAAAIR